MQYLLYAVQIIFYILTVGLIINFLYSRKIRALVMATVYGSTAVLSFYMLSWLPLAVGFVLAWILRFLGLEPLYFPPKET